MHFAVKLELLWPTRLSVFVQQNSRGQPTSPRRLESDITSMAALRGSLGGTGRAAPPAERMLWRRDRPGRTRRLQHRSEVERQRLHGVFIRPGETHHLEQETLWVTTLSQHGHNTVTTQARHGHNTGTTWSQHGHNMAKTWSRHGHKAAGETKLPVDKQ